MEFVVLGWPPDGPTLRLDYRRFSYAGKFVMSTTGKAVVRTTDANESLSGTNSSEFDDEILAAVAFNADRSDPETLWLRYVTVRKDRRGDGLGGRLCAFVADRAAGHEYGRVNIAVNNPFAYEALYRAGFSFTGDETGLAELVLSRPAESPSENRSKQTYQDGLDRYRERELSDGETSFLQRKRSNTPPEVIQR